MGGICLAISYVIYVNSAIVVVRDVTNVMIVIRVVSQDVRHLAMAVIFVTVVVFSAIIVIQVVMMYATLVRFVTGDVKLATPVRNVTVLVKVA